MRFNRFCLGFALLWLFVSVPWGLIHRPTVPDFGQFYLGGTIVLHGDWDALYPIPLPGSLDNPGLYIHSYARPRWKLLAQVHRVPDYTHFMLPPPSALVFAPLALMSYSQAYWIWIFLSFGCVWGVAFVAGLLLRRLIGHASRWEGVLALLIVLSPMTARAIRIANVSPQIALLLAVTLLALVREEQPIRAAGAVLMGALLKYATLILIPLLVVMRRWRTLCWLAVLGALVTLVTLDLAGTKPFSEFYTSIMPTLSRPSWFYGNQSLPGLMARVFGRPFSLKLNLLLASLRSFTMGAIIALMLSARARHWRDPANVFAATGLLIGWLLVFSPISWEHWPIFLCPIWGWILWEARHPGWRRFVALASLALMYLPGGILQVSGFATYPILLPEPFNSSQLLGVVLLLILGYWRLSTNLVAQEQVQAQAEERVPGRLLREPQAMQKVAEVSKLK